ncbi:hypothetical protein MSAN_01519400 [Mycena sanguinolenta]|uniref:Secreted protein n=1 Tax=Mycena sanguinolenta TaxID=230812 RepID=A0A8H6Y7L1_9AGAR|nr:hypothetical protein MSAN_01519400 [Mycena sanguinolenta]
MKLLASLAMCAALATTAFSEAISIQSPADGTTVQAGSSLTVEVIQHNSLSNFVEVGLAIGLGAPNIAPGIGPNILYNGPWDPQPQNNAVLQNFTVTIPSSTPTGLMSLNVAHFFMVGVDLFPTTGTVNITLNVV